MEMIRGRWMLIVALAFTLGAFRQAAAQMTLDMGSRVQALEAELQKIKAEQAEFQEETLAQRGQAPRIAWRPGRGLNIRGAKREFEFNFAWVTQFHTAFFPNDSNLPTGQGSTKLRRLRPMWSFKWEDGLFETGTIVSFEAAPSVRFLGGGVRVNLQKFSPYYPRLNLLGVQAMSNPRGTQMSSRSGLALDRDLMVGSILTSGSAKGYGLQWLNTPVGMGRIKNFDISINTGVRQFSSKTSSDPIDRKGVGTGITYEPFSGVKGSALKGLDVGVAYFLAPTDFDEARGGRPIPAISTLSRNNGVDIWNLGVHGDWWWVAPNMGYRYGPYRFEASYEHTEMDRDFRGTRLDALGNLDDAEVKGFVIRNGWFFWGNERGGLRLSHTFNRVDFDAGSDFDIENDFDEMRRYHVMVNSLLLTWFQRPNVTWKLNWDHYDFSRMAGGGDAEDAREGLGIGEDGGTHNEIILAVDFRF